MEIIYNVTCHVAEQCHDSWIHWMQSKHIPEMLATGKFTQAKLVKVLVDEQMGGITYAVQYSSTRTLLDSYFHNDAPALREEGLALFGEQVLYFRTELQVISEHEG